MSAAIAKYRTAAEIQQEAPDQATVAAQRVLDLSAQLWTRAMVADQLFDDVSGAAPTNA